MSEDLKIRLQIYETRYEELHKILTELTELNIIKMRSKTPDTPENFFDKFQDMVERVISDIEEVKKECRRLHKIVYPEKYIKSDDE